MKDLQTEARLIELLAERETAAGLSKEKETELEELLTLFPEWNYDETFALTAAAISLTAVSVKDNLPKNLQSKILADSEKFFADRENSVRNLSARQKPESLTSAAGSGLFEKIFGNSFWKWGGWAVAAACALLALNLWLTRVPKDQIAANPQAQNAPQPVLGVAEQRDRLLATAPDKIQTTWTDFNPKQPRGVKGDVVWSNAQQKGFISLHGLPVNDKAKETYQLWIFDAEQNAKTPVDGGVFDIDSNGDAIVPINAKIKVGKPTMFAVTAEKPGGVVVSDLSKVMTVAKV